ncbi:MAG: efflux RND transporter periplasmic adaptor subunit [Quisquiliibacterium sp.]
MPESSPSSKRGWFWRFLVLLILAGGVGGFIALQKFKPRPAVRAVVKQLPLVRAQPVQLASGPLEVVGNGLVRPRTQVLLGAEVSGRVVAVADSMVTGGRFANADLLVTLDAEPFRAALAQAQADRRAAQFAFRLAEQRLQRTDALIAKGFMSSQTRDEHLANRDQTEAVLQRAQAAERQRELDLARTRIRAPFGGQVLSKRVEVGDTVQPGRELARIFASGDLEVSVSLTDRDMALVRDPWAGGQQGGQATVVVDHGGQRYQWPARLDRVEAAVDAATRTFNLVVRVPDPLARGKPLAAPGAAGVAMQPGPPLIVGMYASVRITGREQGSYALIPRTALRDGPSVWLLGAGDRVSIRPVKVLLERDDSVAITADSLSNGDRIVVSDLAAVTEGLEVRVVQPR